MKEKITLAHSPDSDDAFMFYALARGKIDDGGYAFKHILKDIETLNRAAEVGRYDITAISFHAYAYVHKLYRLTRCGASIGDRYGPVIVSKRKLTPDSLKGKTIAIPGTATTAYLALRLYAGDVKCQKVRFDKIPEAVLHGDADAGLLIHEGQLTYRKDGLHKVVDLGEWWWKEHRLPLPLGGNCIRRSFSAAKSRTLADILKRSIVHGLEERKSALTHAMRFARGMSRKLSDKFVGMYVNDYTVDIGEKGMEAVALLLDLGYRKKIIPHKVAPDFV